jgi:hypothetical protein
MGRFQFRFLALLGVALMAAGTVSPIHAQDPDDLKRAVARISLMEGQVSVRRGDANEWVAGVINAPLMADDRIATAPNSRTEVQLDASHMVRIGGAAEIHLTQLEYGRYQMEVAKGTVTYRILRPSKANAEVDTPAVSVRPSHVGTYRISVNDSGETEVTVRAGEVEVFTPKGSQWVNAGQTMMARGTATDPEFQIVSAIPNDEWDRWNDNRDHIFMQPSPSAQYIDEANSGVYGTEELDANGTWVSSPDYGPVWRPTAVGPGWAPYSSGRWVWEDWYGWTWVSYDPWGWAPYHYGRWFNNGGFGWCWYPGARGFHSYWSPALVGWFGFGGGVGVGFGFGHVGWVPLAPFEVFHPWWGRGYYGNFGRNINITNVNITNVYRNARVANGVSGMAAADFRGGRFNTISHVSSEQVRTAGMIRGQVPIAPTSANLHYSDRQAGFTPQGNGNQRFFSHQQLSTPTRIPFSQQQRALGGGTEAAGHPAATQLQSPGRSGATMPQRQSTAGSPVSQGTGRPSVSPETNTRPGGSTGWRRFGEPASQGSAPQASNQRNEPSGARSNPSVNTENTRPSQAQGNRGWNSFGSPGNSQPNRQPQGSNNQSTPRYNAPSYSAPRSAPAAPSYSAPRSAPAPSNSAPRGGGGGGGGSRPSSGGGGHSSSGGGGHHR